MVENTETWAGWMTGLGILAVVLIFGIAWYWVNALRSGNRRFRFFQRRHQEPAPQNREYPDPGVRDDLR